MTAMPQDEGPLVSVIVPAYNAESTLSATLESVLSQTHRRIEVIVVDDGSQDATGMIARRLAETDPRLRVLSQPNSGVARARNHALSRCSGDFIAWIDADDIWHPTKLARQLDIFRKSRRPLSFVYSGYRLINEDDLILPNIRPLTDVSGDTLCLQIASNFFSNTSSLIVPRAVIQAIGGHEPRLRDWKIEGAEDFLLQLQLAMSGPAGCCRSALVGYRMHGRNMSSHVTRAARSNLKVIELVEKSAPAVPAWVFREGRARVVGYVGYLLRRGDVASAAAIFGTIFGGQPLRTVSMCGRLLRHAVRDATLGPALPDPAIGLRFLDADPDSAPWGRPMLMSAALLDRLAAIDRARAACPSMASVRPGAPSRALPGGADLSGSR
jgi:glycosyltransferase involved in cell wall biosynthesis